jgi:hypothetical protein
MSHNILLTYGKYTCVFMADNTYSYPKTRLIRIYGSIVTAEERPRNLLSVHFSSIILVLEHVHVGRASCINNQGLIQKPGGGHPGIPPPPENCQVLY